MYRRKREVVTLSSYYKWILLYLVSSYFVAYMLAEEINLFRVVRVNSLSVFSVD